MLTSCKIIITILMVSLLPLPAAQAVTGTLTISGTGDSTSLLRALASSFELKNPGTEIIIPESVGSSGGIKLLAKKRTDFARIARHLTKKEKGLSLTVVLFAMSPIVFTVNKHAAQLVNISTEQIIRIYNGTLTKWHDLGVDLDRIYPVIREEGDSSRRVLGKFIVIFGENNKSTAKILYSTPKTVQTLLRYKQTIGFIPMSAAMNTELHVLAVDNIYPNLVNVQSGKYKFVVPLSLVYAATPSPLGEAFLKFLSSQDSLKTIFKNGAIPTL